MASLFRNKFVIIAIVVLVAFGAWYAFTTSSAPASVLTSTSSDTDQSDQAIVTTLVQLQSITLSGAIFSNQAFASLQDFTTAIVPEPVGRPDPFAPLNAQVAPAAGSNRGAQIFQAAK